MENRSISPKYKTISNVTVSMERRMANMHYEFSNIIDNVVIPSGRSMDYPKTSALSTNT